MTASAYGFIEVWPNPCPIFEGERRGAAAVTWTSTAVQAEVTVQPLDGGAAVISTAASGYQALEDIRPGEQYLCCLHDVTSGSRQPLASVILTTEPAPGNTPPSGALTASPNPSLVGGAHDHGTSLISWRTRRVRQAQVTLQVEDRAENVFAEGIGGELPFTVLYTGVTHVFRLYDVSGSGRVLLDTLEVTASPGALINASPNPCSLHSPDVDGISAIVWATPGDAPTDVTVQSRGGAETLFSNVPRGHLPFTEVKPHGWYTFRLYDTSTGERRLLDSVVLTGHMLEASRVRQGVISASPTVCQLDARRSGTTVISWSTQNVPSVEVTMQTGDTETVLATNASGTRTISDIRDDRPYVFRLYDVSSEERFLLDGVIVAAV